jgi:chaperone required for assembly of F1-ATPase
LTAWAAKRFWKAASTEPVEGGFTIWLDGRAVKTPAKAPLVLPTLAMAQAIAVEWDAQDGLIKPDTMPLTRAANSTIDKVAPLRAEVIAELAGYGGTDLLCYHAESPQALIARQQADWGPLLDWAAATLHAPLTVTQGIIPVPQPQPSLDRLHAAVSAFTNPELAGLHDLVAISGSLILALAVTSGHLAPDAAFSLSRLDNSWQAEQWGTDEDEAELEALRRAAFLQAHRFFGLCR